MAATEIKLIKPRFVITKSWENTYEEYYCPSCQEQVTRKNSYCPACGQKVLFKTTHRKTFSNPVDKKIKLSLLWIALMWSKIGTACCLILGMILLAGGDTITSGIASPRSIRNYLTCWAIFLALFVLTEYSKNISARAHRKQRKKE